MLTLKQTPLPQRPLGRKARKTVNRMIQNDIDKMAPKIIVTAPAPSGSRKRRRRRARQASMLGADVASPLVQYSPSTPLQNPLMPQAPGVSTSRSNMVRARMNMLKGARISQEGMRFLKCAFSAADFDGSGTYGVPDQYSGRSMALKHRSVNSMTFLQEDYYFILAPTPGIAFWQLHKPAGTPIVDTDAWDAVPYSDFKSLFGGASGNDTFVTKFRFVSNHFEITPTTNANHWTGSIQVFKLPLQVASSQTPTLASNRLTITGMNGINSNNGDMYSGPFNLGTYVGAFNKDCDFEYSQIWNSQPTMPSIPQAGDFGKLDATILGGPGEIPGFDNKLESVVIKVSGITSATNTCLLRTWSCVEYQFQPGSVMYETQNLKCVYDPIALEMYRRIVIELPTAVSFLDNANFWTRVLSIIRQISGGLSVLPGPYGLAAGGVNSIATAVEQLVL